MTCGLLGSFYTCDKETHSDSLVLYDDVNYLYSIRTFALINFFVTGSKSYLSNCPNGIRPLSTKNGHLLYKISKFITEAFEIRTVALNNLMIT